MANKKESKIGNWLGAKLYALIAMHHTEDYVSEDPNGNLIITSADIWRANAVRQGR